jgi:hypothetical protein
LSEEVKVVVGAAPSEMQAALVKMQAELEAMRAATPNHVIYWAISVFNSKTVGLNMLAFVTFVLSILQMQEVITFFPTKYLPMIGTIVAVGNMYLRTKTVRPVAFIAPFAVAPVVVKKLGPPNPAPPTLSD